MKNAVIGIGSVLVILVIAWVLLFGPHQPCDAAHDQVLAALATQPREVTKAALDATDAAGSLQCAVIAARLRFGDDSVLHVVTVGADSAPPASAKKPAPASAK